MTYFYLNADFLVPLLMARVAYRELASALWGRQREVAA